MKTGIKELTHRQGWLYGTAIGIFLAILVVGL
jgi:hypothetical protein